MAHLQRSSINGKYCRNLFTILLAVAIYRHWALQTWNEAGAWLFLLPYICVFVPIIGFCKRQDMEGTVDFEVEEEGQTLTKFDVLEPRL